MELIQYLDIIRKWLWLIILATVIAAGSSLVASYYAIPVYETTTTVIISQAIQEANPDLNTFLTSQRLAQTYADLIKREPILSATVQALDLEQSWTALQKRVSVTLIRDTQLMEISVQDTSPTRARNIANEVARQLIQQSPTTDPGAQERIAFAESQLPELEARIKAGQAEVQALDEEISGATSAEAIQEAQQHQNLLNAQINQWRTTYGQLLVSLQQGSTNYISIVEPAAMPTAPVSPRTAMNVMLASVVGLMLALGAAFLIEYLDDTVKTPDEVQAVLGVPTLTVIGKIAGNEYTEKLVAVNEPRSPITEAYRALRTNLQFSTLDTPVKSIMVTSPSPTEGKSVNAANLAVVLAQTGMSVVLVDSDLRRPVMHKMFGLSNSNGLTNLLMAREGALVAGRGPFWTDGSPVSATFSLDGTLQESGIRGLRILTSGPLPPNPAEVLGSERMRMMLEALEQQADIVVFDSPPCVTLTDAVVLGRLVDGVILIVEAGRTRRVPAERAGESLRSVGAKLLGAVINRVDPKGSGYSYYYYYSYYTSQYYYGSDEKGKKSKNNKSRGRRRRAATPSGDGAGRKK